MNPEAFLVGRPAIDFSTFYSVTEKVLGYNTGLQAAFCGRQLSDTETFLSCLAAFKDPKAPARLHRHLLNQVSFSVLVFADDCDLTGILELCGMPFTTSETTIRGVFTAVIHGTLKQWRDAVKHGSSANVEPPVRRCFNRIYQLLQSEHVDVWTDCTTRETQGNTFLLEDKRTR